MFDNNTSNNMVKIKKLQKMMILILVMTIFRQLILKYLALALALKKTKNIKRKNKKV